MGRQSGAARAVVLGVVVLCGIATAGIAQDCLEQIGWMENNIGYEVEASGKFAYLGGGPDFVVVDASDPAQPLLVGELALPGFGIQDIAVSGDFAYVVGVWDVYSFSGLLIIDVSNPEWPILRGALPIMGRSTRVAVSDNEGYVLDPDFGLYIIDVSDPDEPTLLGTYETNYPISVAVASDHAYITTTRLAFPDLTVVDVSDPAQPRYMGSIMLYSGISNDVVVSGGYAYVLQFLYPGNDLTVLTVVDVRDSGNPFIMGWISEWNAYGRRVAVSGNFAYVACNPPGLWVIDVSDPWQPVEVASIDNGGVTDVAVSGGLVFARTPEGVAIFRECSIFANGFESGDCSAWSSEVP